MLASGACWLAAGALARVGGAAPRSRVVLVRRPDVLDGAGAVRFAVLGEMLDDGVRTLLAADSAGEAWRRLVSPADVVGVKSNGWGSLPTPPELEGLLVQRIRGVGVAADRVAVADQTVLSDPVFRRATALINTRPMRTHAWSGLGTCLKNYIMFTEEPSHYHPDACDSLGAVWLLPHVKGKTRLNVLVMLTPQFHSVGPHAFSRSYTWRYNGLVVGTDPVAVDTVGARIITAKRLQHFGEERPISPPPRHILSADTRYGVGTADPARIELIVRGDDRDLLVSAPLA
jgi:hypothetical protein